MPDTIATDVAPLSPRPETLDFLRTRRSRPPKTLGLPVPDRESLNRFCRSRRACPITASWNRGGSSSLNGPPAALAGLTAEIGAAEGRDPDALAKDVAGFADANLVVAVILSPKPSEKDPGVGAGDVGGRRVPVTGQRLPRRRFGARAG
jgi:hypothetical protein